MERVQDRSVDDTEGAAAADAEAVAESVPERLRAPRQAIARDRLRLVSVSKTYPGTTEPAVEDVDLTIEPGEFFSILGPSGSGKTTTLRLIAGFEQPSAGSVWLGDSEITGRPPYRRPIHTVFQNYALFPHMNVRQNVGYPLKMAGVAKAEIRSRVDEFLARVAVTDFAERMPHQLSGGQRQRVALARALVPQPQLVLLDEPLGALDLKLREEMQLVLQHIQREVGITFVYVTHDQGEALAMSDHIAIMAEGRLHQVGSPEDVYKRPETTFVARFVGNTNLLECERRGPDTAVAGELSLKVGPEPPDSAFHLSVRPEAIRLGAAAASCDNTVAGTIEEAIFQGSDVDLRIRAGQHLFRARGEVASYGIGQTVDIGWNAVDAVGIQADAVAAPQADASNEA